MSTLLDALGGRDALTVLVAGLYQRLLNEPMVAPHFATVPRWRLEEHLVEFLVTHLGDAAGRWYGRDLGATHVDLGLSDRHFDAFMGCWAATLAAAGVAEPLRTTACARLEALRRRVIAAVAHDLLSSDPEEPHDA